MKKILLSITPNKENQRIALNVKLFSCLCCGKEFTSTKACKSREPKYCSKECYSKSTVKLKTCPACSKQFPSNPNTKYCSVDCFKSVGKPSRKGVSLSPQWRLALSQGRKNSVKCKGENLYNWKGGKETFSERSAIYFNNRRSRQTIKLDKNFLSRLLVAQENKCFFCESDLTLYKAIEHLTPLTRGGDNQVYNIVYSCKSCNSKKRTQTFEEFAIRTGRIHLIDKFDFIFSSAL